MNITEKQNSNQDQYSMPLYFVIYSFTVHPVLTILYCIVMFLFYKHQGDFSNPYYILVKALACADFVVNIFMGFFSHITAQFWISHSVGTVITFFVIGFGYYGSFILSVFIAVNRFFAVVFYMKFKIMMKNNMYYLCVFLSFSFGLGYAAPFYIMCIIEADVDSRFSFSDTGFGMCSNAYLYMAPREQIFSLSIVSLIALLYLVTAAAHFKRTRENTLSSATYVKEIKLMFQGFLLFVLICLSVLSSYVIFSDWYILTCLYVTVNPILYLLFDKTVRNHFFKHFGLLKCFSNNSVSSLNLTTVRVQHVTN